jgi:hypothetical protein
LVSGDLDKDGYTDKVVSRDDPGVLKWVEKYPWFIPYFNYKTTFTEQLSVSGTQCILWNKQVLLEKGSKVKRLGALPREDTYLTKMTGPGLFVSDARCYHFESPLQVNRGQWDLSMFYRIHEVIMADPEGFVSLFGRDE